MLDFLTSMEVGKTVPVVDEDAGSEASEWELRERTEQEEERRAEVLGTGEEPPLFLPTPPFMTSTGGSSGEVVFSLCHFLCHFPWCAVISSGTGPPGGGYKGNLQRAASRGLRRGEPGKMYAAMIYIGRMRV